MIERFLDKIAIVPHSGCWIWLGGVTKYGSASIKWKGRARNVRRVLYEIEIGEILEDDIQIVAECGLKECVSPHHAGYVPNGFHISRAKAVQATKSSSTHFRCGHEKTSENSRTRVGRSNECKLCACIAQRGRRSKKVVTPQGIKPQVQYQNTR
jgi:hypothetical protein